VKEGHYLEQNFLLKQALKIKRSGTVKAKKTQKTEQVSVIACTHISLPVDNTGKARHWNLNVL
jgi:hypothetical protein